MSISYGFVETKGTIGAIEAADAMLKAAQVKLTHKREIGFALVTIIIEGELGAVQAAVAAGTAAAKRVGEFVTCNVIARPYDDEMLLGMPGKVATKIKKIDKSETKTEPEKKSKSFPAKTVANRKQKKTEAEPLVDETDEREILSELKKGKGLTIQEISLLVKKDPSVTRIILKKLIDKNLIEKVQQHYYLI